MPDHSETETPTRESRLTIGAVSALIVAVATALGLFSPFLRQQGAGSDRYAFLVVVAGVVLGGPSALGVPWLLYRKYNRRSRADRRWSPGRLIWFAHGSAAWLLWPPIVANRFVKSGPFGQAIEGAASTSQICYFYGTPLMAVYMLLALKFGGRLGRSRRGRRRIDWIERFGLFLAMSWALLGTVVLWMIYANKFQ